MCPPPTVAVGRVGVNRAVLKLRAVMPDVVRVTCDNNPGFWLEVDLTSERAVGALPADMERLPGTTDDDDANFRVRMQGDVVRVDSETCPPFWLEIHI